MKDMTISLSLKQVNTLIDELSTPEDMSPAEAVEFYETLMSDLEAKIDGVRDDMKADRIEDMKDPGGEP